MSKLSALATLAQDKINRLNTNHIHLVSGAIGGYLGAKKGYSTAMQNWKHLDRSDKAKYSAAYGRDGKKIFARKSAISGAITGAVGAYHTSRTVEDVGRFAISTAKGYLADRKYYAKKPWEKNRQNQASFIYTVGRRRQEKPESFSKGLIKHAREAGKYVKENALGYVKNKIKDGAVDLALEHGASNAYGEITRYLYRRRREHRQGILTSSHKSRSGSRGSSKKSR